MLTKIIAIAMSILFAVTITYLTIRLKKDRRDRLKREAVYCHRSLIFLLITVAVLLTVVCLLVFCYMDRIVHIIGIFFLAVSLLCLCIAVCSANIRIMYDENEFSIRDFFGKEKSYTYNDITGRKEVVVITKSMRDRINDNIYLNHKHFDGNPIALYLGDRKIIINGEIGGENFLAYTMIRYRQLHDGEDIPKTEPTWFDGAFKNGTGRRAFIMMLSIVSVMVLIAFLLFGSILILI